MKEKWTEEMRRKLEGHRKAPPEGLWEGISEQMGFKPKEAGKEAKHPGVASHPAAKRWYWAAAAAVLLIGGFFTFYHHDGKDSSSLTATTVVLTEDTPKTEPTKVVAEAETPTAEKPLTQKMTPTAGKPLTQKMTPTAGKPLNEKMTPTAEKPLTEKMTTLTKKWANTAKTQAAPPITVSEHQEPAAEEPKTPTPPSPTDQNLTADAQPIKQKAEKSEMASMEPVRRQPSSKGKWTMGLQASGGLLASGNHNGSMNKSSSYMAANYNYNGITLIEAASYMGYDMGYATNSKPETSHSKHHLPVRFGMSLQYQLNDRLALLSGINYTWLYSEFTKGNSTTDQRLHYLGVPVGVAYRLWSNQRLQCYLSGSAMLEKCLNEKPWQWSVNAGAGAEYAITKQAGLYLEPALGYHFDDGSSLEHYYKDHPLAPSIMFGLRMHINE